jgi:hypothetical protein
MGEKTIRTFPSIPVYSDPFGWPGMSFFPLASIDCVLHGLHQEFHQQRERTTLAAQNIDNRLDDHSEHLEDRDEDEGPQQTTGRDKIDKVCDFYLAGPCR